MPIRLALILLMWGPPLGLMWGPPSGLMWGPPSGLMWGPPSGGPPSTSAGAVANAQPGDARIGAIDFFGYTGLDVYAVRSTLLLREGDPLPPGERLPEASKAIRGQVTQAIGLEPTDVTFVCCDAQRRWLLYIGLPGKSSRRPALNPVPTGDVRLPQAILRLRQELDVALEAGIASGVAAEDGSQGFALSAYAPAREKQFALRRIAREHETTLFVVLESSSDPRHRAVAAHALGYGRQSDRQVDALVRASLDPADGVRNDAMRALAVLVRARSTLARRIAPGPFIDLLRSGTWSDRNKAVMLLDVLSVGRDPAALAALRVDAMDALTEMARWKFSGHALSARMIIGRIGGINEKRLIELAAHDDVETILGALNR